ncbi:MULTISPECIES: macro domain-containing protein [Halomonadaceae]|uniref:macro domain-containing protein n=1 Tax=Halomonadaceae TaxID=28256 RepID=UPI0015817B57|nr:MULTISPECIES: macro domain-containing protein [Halomonas]MDI4638103.1 macro domain-containing protein [Halomonas sp. BMC7]NUJ59105.1 macro domain-containing protein [Halomonas taeanensis]
MTAKVQIECRQGDIAHQPDMDAVVNAANAQLMSGGGVAGALHRAAGPGLAHECQPKAPIRPGQAVITGAHDLPNRHVTHCLGPVYGRDEPSDALLASCYREAIILAEEHELISIAFPALSTDAFGYPMNEATRVALTTVLKEAQHCHHLRQVRFILHDGQSLALYQQTLSMLQDAESS